MAQKTNVEYIRYYTDGSAARQPETYRPQPKTSLPKPRKRRVYKIVVDPIAMVGIAVAVVMLVMMLSCVSELRAEQQRLQQMQSYVQQLRAECHELTLQCEEKIDLSVIEEQALTLGMIPVEQAKHITIHVPQPEQEAQPEQISLWDNISAFFGGLFA